ncbi:MAG: nucleotide exchange factor GrpE [Magnetospirillum sp. WYHS-4]
MSDENANAATQETPAAEAPAAETAPPEAEAPAPDARLAELEAKVADLDDKWRRSLAEAENVRRRAERDKQDAAKYGTAGFAKEMLSVADNLARALASVDEAARAAHEGLANLWTGIEMTQRDMLNAFERLGVKPVAAEGQRLNPHVHEAMMELDNPNVPAGTVLHVAQTGYILHDRLLRPAKVVVSKGGPKEAPPPAPEAKAESHPHGHHGHKAKEKAQAYEGKAEDKDKGAQLDEKL